MKRLNPPPAQVQRQQQPAVDALRVKLDEAFVAALRIVPRLPASAVLPEVVPHRAHLHADGPLQMLLDFHYELVRPIPALIVAAQDRAAINRIEVDAVE